MAARKQTVESEHQTVTFLLGHRQEKLGEVGWLSSVSRNRYEYLRCGFA
jgi:hypothetical protein